MFSFCSKPIKANKIILYRTQDSQHSIRTAQTKRWWLMTGRSALMSTVHANCEFVLCGIWNSRFPTFYQNSTNKETTTCDWLISNHVQALPMQTACELWICSSWKWLFRNQMQLVHAINDLSSSRHMYPSGTYFCNFYPHPPHFYARELYNPGPCIHKCKYNCLFRNLWSEYEFTHMAFSQYTVCFK